MKTKYLLLVITIVFFLSCNVPNTKISDEVYISHIKKGDEITNLAQATLLGNVSNAMQKGGPSYAIEFCNLSASTLIDSLSRLNNCVISRVSEKNRNPENNLKSEPEKKIWKLMQTKLNIDTLIQDNQSLVYYKSIKIALPACLKCHGVEKTDISPATLEKINQLYPRDLATGYQLNDFRGLWKVEFKTNEMNGR